MTSDSNHEKSYKLGPYYKFELVMLYLGFMGLEAFLMSSGHSERVPFAFWVIGVLGITLAVYRLLYGFPKFVITGDKVQLLHGVVFPKVKGSTTFDRVKEITISDGTSTGKAPQMTVTSKTGIRTSVQFHNSTVYLDALRHIYRNGSKHGVEFSFLSSSEDFGRNICEQPVSL